ncbi:MAG TPA: hypothetical protein PLT75_16305 [Spirochaetota bacterium]|nr:hypothetical protein [Spirochaetota bacterium]
MKALHTSGTLASIIMCGLFSVVLLFTMDTRLVARNFAPVQISLYNPHQLFDESYDIILFRINLLYGRNRGVSFLDIGTVNSAEDFAGLQGGIVNIVDDLAIGVQLGAVNYMHDFFGIQAGLVNINYEIFGIQLGLFNYHTTRACGLQVGIIGTMGNIGYLGGSNAVQISGIFNSIEYSEHYKTTSLYRNYEKYYFKGAQISIILNKSDVNFSGAQVGFVNIADRISGVQIGIVNIARRMSGVQIGLINIIREGALPFFPIFNASMSM